MIDARGRCAGGNTIRDISFDRSQGDGLSPR